MSYVRFGFAAGCEAVALPRRSVPSSEGQSPNQGHSPKTIQPQAGAGKPRLTSGGKAEDKTMAEL